MQICTTYDVSAEDLFDQWCAYTASNLNGAEPTVHTLEAMERKEFGRHTKDIGSLKKAVNVTPKSSKTSHNDINEMYPLIHISVKTIYS